MSSSARFVPDQGKSINSIEDLDDFFLTTSGHRYTVTKSGYGIRSDHTSAHSYKLADLYCFIPEALAREYLLTHAMGKQSYRFAPTTVNGVYKVEWYDA
jgi:hypothetical protein